MWSYPWSPPQAFESGLTPSGNPCVSAPAVRASSTTPSPSVAADLSAVPIVPPFPAHSSYTCA